MNRNTQEHFAMLPEVNIGRSKFDRGFTHTTTFNTGELVPVYVDPDIVPGDTVTMRQSEIIRMTTPICPVMDNAMLDFYWFFIPNRLVMTDWKKLMGENETAPWTQTTEVTVPQIKINNNNQSSNKLVNTVVKGSVLDHMGIPTQNSWTYAASGTSGSKQIKISQLPTRAYCLVWNEFFRDENLQNPVNVPKDNTDANLLNENYGNYISNPDATQVSYASRGGLPCLKVCKPHDYFTSALPQPQKGPAVALPLSADTLPVEYTERYIKNQSDTNYKKGADSEKGDVFVRSVTVSGSTDNIWSDLSNVGTGTNPDYTFETLKPISPQSDMVYGVGVDLTKATGATVNALRQAFAIQKFYERDARGGWAKA